jgi:hypothetical protein
MFAFLARILPDYIEHPLIVTPGGLARALVLGLAPPRCSSPMRPGPPNRPVEGLELGAPEAGFWVVVNTRMEEHADHLHELLVEPLARCRRSVPPAGQV